MRLFKIKISIFDREEYDSFRELGMSNANELPSEQLADCWIDLDKVTGVWSNNNGKICIHVSGDSWWTDGHSLEGFMDIWRYGR